MESEGKFRSKKVSRYVLPRHGSVSPVSSKYLGELTVELGGGGGGDSLHRLDVVDGDGV